MWSLFVFVFGMYIGQEINSVVSIKETVVFIYKSIAQQNQQQQAPETFITILKRWFDKG